MGIKDITEAINGVAPMWSNIKSALRGTPLYGDTLLRGTSRFSRKTGNIGLINPDIEMALTEKLQVTQNYITIDRENPWLTVGGYISVSDLEKFKITNIENKIITLATGALLNQDIGAFVILYSVPCISVNSYSANTKVIQIRSKHPIILGDKLAFPLQTNLFREIQITEVIELSPTTNVYNLTYQITLESGIPYNIAVDGELQLRAFPAYFSDKIKIPKHPLDSSLLGPILIDYYSGKIQNGETPQVYCTLQEYNIFEEKLHDNPIAVQKNHPIFNRSFASDVIVFWDLLAGSFKQAEKASGICNSDGHFGVTYNLYPTIPPGSKWKLEVTSDYEVTVKVAFEPNEPKVYSITAFTTTNIEVGTEKGGIDIERITITVSGTPNAVITFGDWVLQQDETERLSFNVMAMVEREAQWLSSSLIVKPYFLTKSYILATYDSTAIYDSGYIYR